MILINYFYKSLYICIFHSVRMFDQVILKTFEVMSIFMHTRPIRTRFSYSLSCIEMENEEKRETQEMKLVEKVQI